MSGWFYALVVLVAVKLLFLRRPPSAPADPTACRRCSSFLVFSRRYRGEIVCGPCERELAKERDHSELKKRAHEAHEAALARYRDREAAAVEFLEPPGENVERSCWRCGNPVVTAEDELMGTLCYTCLEAS